MNDPLLERNHMTQEDWTEFVKDAADEVMRRYNRMMRPNKFDWREHTCGECGYFLEVRKGEIMANRSHRMISGCACRKTGMDLNDPFDTACPDLVLREAPHD